MTARSTLLFFLISTSLAFAEPCPVPVNQKTLAKYCPRMKAVKGKTHPDTCRFDIESPKALMGAKLDVDLEPFDAREQRRQSDLKKVVMAGMMGSNARVKDLAPKDGVEGFVATGSEIDKNGISVRLHNANVALTLNVDVSLCDEDQAEALARALLAAAPKH